MSSSPGSPQVPSMAERLVFLVSPPRSGSTLLMRILNATSSIYSRPEPHLMTPLAHLGYYENVDMAPYDHIQSRQAVHDFVKDLPRGEDDYLDALRAYADIMYGRMLSTAPQGERYFLDKTPAYALVVEFLARLYPEARFLVLTRHPAAIFSSYAESFFDGDHLEAARFNPILARYIPKMAWLLRQDHLNVLHVSYEDLASDPEPVLERISAFLDIPFEPEALNYQRKKVVGEGLGDPTGVQQHQRPVTSSIHKWARSYASDEEKVRVVAEQLALVSDQDLETWGTPREALWRPLLEAEPGGGSTRKWDRYSVERRALVWLRKDIHQRPWGELLRKVRFATDVLLRHNFSDYGPPPAPDSPAGRGEPEAALPPAVGEEVRPTGSDA